jgi:hypothetical protein
MLAQSVVNLGNAIKRENNETKTNTFVNHWQKLWCILAEKIKQYKAK